MLAALCAVALIAAFPAAADAGAAVTLSKVTAKKKPSSLVTFSGKAGTKANGKVTVQRRVGRKWRTIAKGRTAKRGKFALTWVTPSKKSSVSVRAKLGSSVSKARSFKVLAPKKGAPKIKVSPKTQIISAAAIDSVPKPGKAGKVTIAGGNDTAVGKIIVIGAGPDSPNGFIGRVTDVDRSGGQTVATTKPATLLQAVPEGSIDAVSKAVKAARTEPRAGGKITCTGSGGISLTPDVAMSASLAFDANWSGFSLQNASLTASADLDASIEAAIGAAGSCSLEKRALLSVKGPTLSTFVGPVPIVITSDLKVYFDASASAEAKLSTSASAGFTASAGVSWTKGAGFAGSKSFEPRFSFQPPTLSAKGNIGAHLTPTVDVLLYGLVGPRFALKTGVDFDADTLADPWWTLSVPVDLTASLAIPALDLESPLLHVYQRSFTIADAGGPFGSTPAPLGPVHNVQTPASSIATGYAHSCALRPAGTAACWGSNSQGQLGRGAAGNSLTPVAVSGLTDAAAIVAGNNNTCALRVDGGVVCWGSNGKGETGSGSAGDKNAPVAVKNVSNAVGISAGDSSACAVLQNGHVTCWGADGSTAAEIGGIVKATSIASGTFKTCAVLRGGTVTCWAAGSGTATPVAGITNAVAVSGGANHSCALLATGSVVCWGDGFYGQIGNGSFSASGNPAAVSGITNATTIESGGAHTCAALATGAVNCWGWNNYGQLGNGQPGSNAATPVGVSGIANGTAVSGGLENTCVRRTTGAISCFGYGADGEMGDGGTATRSTAATSVVGFP